MSNTYWFLSVLSPRTTFQSQHSNNKPCNHWWRLPLCAEFIFCVFFKYLQNPSFIIALWLLLANECTGISKVSWELFLNIPFKSPYLFTTIILGNPNGTKKFPKSHCTAWSDVIYFIPMATPWKNHVIQSRHVRILRYLFWYGVSPCFQKSRNTTSNRVSESIVSSNCCALFEACEDIAISILIWGIPLFPKV